MLMESARLASELAVEPHVEPLEPDADGLARKPTAPTPALAGAVGFESPEVQLQRRAELLGAGALVVQVPPLCASSRGRLAEYIDERIERELAARGAPSPYLACWSSMPDDVEARLADQLFRARTVGASGVAILLGSLAGAASPALSPEDSATVRFLARSTADRPLVLVLDDADLCLRGYEEPVAIARWMVPSEPSPSIALHARDDDEDDEDDEETRLAADARFVLETAHAAAIEPVALAPADLATPEAGVIDEGAPDEAPGAKPLLSAVQTGPDDDEEILGEVVEDEEEASPAKVAELEPARPSEEPAPTRGAHAARRMTAGVPVATPSDAWRAWALALSAARGPQALGTFERLFVESYVPLANAIATGLDDPRALRAHEDFRRSFERAYSDASPTFGLTTRRPRMVMDAFDIATKQARLHNARTAQVLLVDSLRQDLGARARDAVLRRTAGAVTLTGESLLWSALPTTTMRQLETLARGVDALRGSTVDDTPMDSLRGRAAEQVRRMRVGSRELYKLDLVPALLASLTDPRNVRAAADPGAAFDAIGDATGDAIARHLETLPARTLLLVLGDHGFTLDRRGRVTHGGASPEEVLVPAQAWLVGDLH